MEQSSAPDLRFRDHSDDSGADADRLGPERATGITWKAARGDSPLEIKHDAGHKRFATTEGYIRDAEPLRRGRFGQPFPPVPLAVLRPASEPLESSRKSSSDGGVETQIVEMKQLSSGEGGIRTAMQMRTGPRCGSMSRQSL